MRIAVELLLHGFLLLSATENAVAQLEYVAPISAEIKDAQKLNGILLLNTMDFHSRKNEQNLYPASLQIVDPARPWPPVFFVNAKPGGEGLMGNGAFQDFRFHPAAQKLSFFFGENADSGETRGMYIVCDTNFTVLDTFTGMRENIDAHDFQISSAGEYLYMATLDTVMDISALSGNVSDTAVLVTTQKIEIADKAGKLVFSWNPFQHLSVTDMFWEYHLFGKNWTYKGLDWSHGNSVRFTHEGNILYSFRFVGVGKINRQTGEVMWKLGGKSPTIAVPQDAPYVLQHDFHEIMPGVYSIFSNGNEKNPCKTISYAIDEKTATISVEHVYQPTPSFVSKGLGGYNCTNGDCVFNYGLYFSDSTRQKAFELITPKNMLLAEYSTPNFNFPFQVQLVKEWKLKQPRIINESGTLRMNETESEVLWYKIADLTATYINNEPSLKPLEKGTYIAIRRQGFGWLTSEPYSFTP